MSSHVIHVIHVQGLFPAKFLPWSLCHLRLHLASPGTGRCLSNDWRSFAITSPSTGERHSIPRASGKNHRELAEAWKQWVVVLGWWLIYDVSLKPHEMLFVFAHWLKSPVGSAPRWYKLQFLNSWKSFKKQMAWCYGLVRLPSPCTTVPPKLPTKLMAYQIWFHFTNSSQHLSNRAWQSFWWSLATVDTSEKPAKQIGTSSHQGIATKNLQILTVLHHGMPKLTLDLLSTSL